MAEEIKEEKILYTHHLSCTKCSFKFSIDHPSKNNNKIGVDKMKCPICGKPIMLDPAFFNVSIKPSKASQTHMNVEASKVAIEMAGKQRLADSLIEENKMVSVTSTQKGKGFGKTEKIPQKVIDSIEEKVKKSEDFQ